MIALDTTCEHCGGLEYLDIYEIWGDRDFQFETCCEVAHELWQMEMRLWGREEWRAFFKQTAAMPIRDVVVEPEVRGSWTIDQGLELGPVKLADAKDFVRKHHRHTKPPCSWRFGLGCYNGSELVAVAMVGRPVARLLDHTRIVEVNRLCVNPNLEPAVVRHACSKLYAAAAREAKRRGFEEIITYTLETERGTSLKAVGWEIDAKTKGGSWDRKARRRTDSAPTCPKYRWRKLLTKAARKAAARARRAA